MMIAHKRYAAGVVASGNRESRLLHENRRRRRQATIDAGYFLFSRAEMRRKLEVEGSQ